MRFWTSGPRMFGGLIRPGVSFGRSDFRRSSPASAVPAMDYVYVVSGDHGLVKIGISTNPDARLATLQTASPQRLRLAYVTPAYGNAYTVEQEAHRVLAAHRASGEWFNCTPDLAIAAIYGAADRTGVSLSETPDETESAQPAEERLLSWWETSAIFGAGALLCGAAYWVTH